MDREYVGNDVGFETANSRKTVRKYMMMGVLECAVCHILYQGYVKHCTIQSRKVWLSILYDAIKMFATSCIKGHIHVIIWS